MNRRWKTQDGEEREEVCFVDCTCFGNLAEVVNQYCQKGKQVCVQGRLKWDSWEDKDTGNKRSKITVVADTVTFLGGAPQGGDEERDGGGGGGGGGGRYQERPQTSREGQQGRQQYQNRGRGDGGGRGERAGRSAAAPPQQRQAAPARPQPQRGKRSEPPAEPPFNPEDNVFKEDDIPF